MTTQQVDHTDQLRAAPHRDLTGLDRSQLERSLHSVPFLALSPGSVLAPSLAR